MKLKPIRFFTPLAVLAMIAFGAIAACDRRRPLARTFQDIHFN